MSETSSPTGPRGTLSEVCRSLRTGLGLSLADAEARTIGLDPDKPGDPAVHRTQLGQLEQSTYKTWPGPKILHAAAVAYRVPDFLLYGAAAVSLGLDALPEHIPAWVPPQASQLTLADQQLVRGIILRLAQGDPVT